MGHEPACGRANAGPALTVGAYGGRFGEVGKQRIVFIGLNVRRLLLLRSNGRRLCVSVVHRRRVAASHWLVCLVGPLTERAEVVLGHPMKGCMEWSDGSKLEVTVPFNPLRPHFWHQRERQWLEPIARVVWVTGSDTKALPSDRARGVAGDRMAIGGQELA